VDNDMLEHGPGVLARAMSAVAMAWQVSRLDYFMNIYIYTYIHTHMIYIIYIYDMLNVYINIAMYMCTVDCDTLSIFIQPNNSHIIAIGNPYPALPCPSLPFLALPRPPSTGGVWFISAKACSWAGGGWPPPGRPNRRLGSWSRWSVLYNCGQWPW
jgi:hypothetical protein